MNRRKRLLVTLKGAVLVGGYSSPTGFVDAVTALDAEGVPYIPASALKGMLREAVTRLLRGVDEARACILEPETAACGRCTPCVLFGTPGASTEDALGVTGVRAGGAPAALTLGDARVTLDGERRRLRRAIRSQPSVAIDRALRSAVPGAYFQRDLVDAMEAVFETTLEGDCDDAMWAELVAALAIADGIGGGRTRGSGHVSIAFADDPPPRISVTLPASAPANGSALVVVRAEEPLVLGARPPTSELIESLDYISGAALRGAVGAALAKLGVDDAFRRAVVDPATCLSFSDALPALAGAPDQPMSQWIAQRGGIPLRMGRAVLRCKHALRADHQVRPGPQARPRPPLPVDGLIASALASALAHRHGGVIPGRVCDVKGCGQPLQRAAGFWDGAVPTRRIVTRLGRDLKLGAAMTGMLYAVEQIAQGTVFVGSVARLDAAALALLRRIEGRPLRVGRGRTRGQGLVTLTIVDEKLSAQHLGAAAQQARRRRFQRSLEGLRPAVEAVYGQGVTLTTVVARTDVAMDAAAVPNELRRVLFGTAAERVRCVSACVATTRRSGWNEGNDGNPPGPRPMRPVVEAGSAWLFAHPREVAVTPAAVDEVEYLGIGDSRELGMGRVVVDHAMFND